MLTTIEIPDPLFRRAERAAEQRQLSLKQFVTSALELALDKPKPDARRMVRPPIPKTGKHQVPALTNAEMAVVLDEEDARKAR